MTFADPKLSNTPPPFGAVEGSPHKAELRPIGGLPSNLFSELSGLRENPFGVTPDPRYMYQSRTHAEAIASLIIGIEYGAGFQALIAPPGMGKTTLLLRILDAFKDAACTAFLFQIHGESRDFLRQLLLDLGGAVDNSDLVGMQDTINQLLIQERRAGRRTIIAIDEAQSLDASTFETVRLLSNFETPHEKLLQIILAGQPQLARRLAAPDAAQLYQRIPIRTTLFPLDPEDTRNYIEHRLRIAGYSGPPLFTSAAVKAIWERSRGVPREINTLCFNALLLATAAEQRRIDSDILREVVADLDLNSTRFNAEVTASGIGRVQPANRLRLENAAADPPTTSIDQSREAAGPVAVAQSDTTVVPSPLPGRPDSGFSAAPLASLLGREAEAVNSKEVSCSTSEVRDAPRAARVTTESRPRRFLAISKGWIAAIVTLAVLSSLVLVIGKLVKRNAELPSLSHAAAPDQPSTTRTFDNPLAMTEPGAADKSKSFGKLPPFNNIANKDGNTTLVSGTLTRNVPPTRADSQARPDSNLVLAQLIHRVKPIYPPAAREAHMEGRVVLQVLVDIKGAPHNVRVVSGPPVLARAAIDAVQHWRYRPSYLNGRPLESEALVTVKFSLH